MGRSRRVSLLGGLGVGAPGCTIAVANLPSAFGNEEVSTAFSPFGSIVWAKVVADRSKGGGGVKGEVGTVAGGMMMLPPCVHVVVSLRGFLLLLSVFLLLSLL